jgi:hypothetical protein
VTDAEQISFEVQRLTLTADDRLELTGRWFGVRGRRFVRPTLTLVGAQRRARSLADLEHKPWAAEDGTDWVAVFPLQSPGEDVLELELAVAPDIAVSLSPPPELAQLPRERKPSRSAVVRDPPAPETAPRAPKRKAPGRQTASALAKETIEQQRLRIESLEQELERAAGSEVELRSALGRRDAAVEKLKAVLEQQQAWEHDRTIAEKDRDAAERERLTALRERDDARRSWKAAHEGLRDAVGERDQISQELDRALDERDRAIAERNQLASELDRAATERHRAIDERDQAMAQRPEHRPRGPEGTHAPQGAVWATRLFALVVLLGAVAAIAIVVHSA